MLISCRCRGFQWVPPLSEDHQAFQVCPPELQAMLAGELKHGVLAGHSAWKIDVHRALFFPVSTCWSLMVGDMMRCGAVQDCLMLFICPCCPAWELFAKDCIKSMHGNHVVHSPSFQVFILCTTFCSQWAKMQKLRSRNALSKCLQSLFLLLWKLWRHV